MTNSNNGVVKRQLSDAELTPDERKELRELLEVLRFEKKLADRNLKRFAWIKTGAGWFVGVMTAVYIFRDTIGTIMAFFKAGFKSLGGE